MQLNAPLITSNADIAPCLSVVVPVFNEASTVVAIIRRVLEQRPVQEVVVVDDASSDRTWEVLQELVPLAPRVNHPPSTTRNTSA